MNTKLLASTRPTRRRGARALVFVAMACAVAASWWAWRSGWMTSNPPSAAVASVTNANSLESNAVSKTLPSHTLKTIGRTQFLATSSGAPASNSWSVLEAQVALDRLALSPGSIDGVLGSQTRAAVRAFQMREGVPQTGELDAETRARLGLLAPALGEYRVDAADLLRLRPLASTWLGKSEQGPLEYETLLEMIAERSHAHPNLVRKLNGALDWNALPRDARIVVPTVERPAPRTKAAYIQIRLSARTLQVFDSTNRLLAHFPCSIAQRVEKRPVGELRVAVVAPNPDYTFNPEVFPESAEARELKTKLKLQPGPNNPVGTAWIGLDLPGYGIHGTPKPEEVGRTESHGCFRLANWNAEYLLQLVTIGIPVRVEP